MLPLYENNLPARYFLSPKSIKLYVYYLRAYAFTSRNFGQSDVIPTSFNHPTSERRRVFWVNNDLENTENQWTYICLGRSIISR